MKKTPTIITSKVKKNTIGFARVEVMCKDNTNRVYERFLLPVTVDFTNDKHYGFDNALYSRLKNWAKKNRPADYLDERCIKIFDQKIVPLNKN